jgi:hypothetical protein
MAERQTSRELAARVQQQFHKSGRSFRRWVNGLSIVCGAVVLASLIGMAVRGSNWLYEAGPVAQPHRMFENDCAACHDTWAPAARLVTFSDVKTSISDAKCVKCHDGPPHYLGQAPGHGGMSCAACHREHRHDPSLLHTANDQCIACHADLAGHLRDSGRSTGIEATITDFAAAHPEFRIFRANDPKDEAQLRFNHAVHLVHEYDALDRLVKGVLNERGELEDLAKDCTACHQPDVDRRRMRPIHYENHCARCHPLLFDAAGGPNDVVPHERPEVVLGFLTRRANLAAAQGGDLPAMDATDLRRLPGVPFQPPLTASQADEAQRRVREAERIALEHTHTLFGEEAKGGCKFCHAVNQTTSAAGDVARSLVDWEIVPPEIKDRWLEHAEFSHDSHRFLNCGACHHAVLERTQTSDILLPRIEDCRKCHSDASSADKGTAVGAVRSQCIDCHAYHDRREETLAGSLTTDLKPQSGASASP